MESNSTEIQQLRSRLDVLLNQQAKLSSNVEELREQILELRTRINKLAEPAASSTQKTKVDETEKQVIVEKIITGVHESTIPTITPLVEQAKPNPSPASQKPASKSSVESFFGENLANKIGIAIILIGIGVGVKYAIDKNILGPAMRIALGYLAGGIMIGFALFLKKKYENLSAVLFAGGLAVAYIVTFIGYDFYRLYPKMIAFSIMLILTVITSITAIRYDKQIIAIIGLVGAYAVPFLLQDGTGTTFALMTYMTIINCGILFLSFKKAWQPVFSVAFGCTWFIFFILSARAFWSHPSDYSTLLLFGSIFYVLFYATFIVYKMKHREQLVDGGSSIIIINSIVGFTFGILLISELYNDSLTNGIYTLIFAASHALVSLITHRQEGADHRLFYLSLGFALLYSVLSIPLMLDGNWITILWSLQAALFFWIGWKKDDGFFEKISYIPLSFAIFSLISSWTSMSGEILNGFNKLTTITPLANEFFFAGIVLTASLFFMSIVKAKSEKPTQLYASGGFFAFLANSLAYLGVTILYLALLQEINSYWGHQSAPTYVAPGVMKTGFIGAIELKSIWMIIFSLVYLSAIQHGNRFFVKDKGLSIALATASLVAVLVFLFFGLYEMSELRDRMIAENFSRTTPDYGLAFSIRYIGFMGLALLLWTNWFVLRHFNVERIIRRGMEILIHICLVWIACSELIHLKRINGGGDFYRAGLTIFGGIYSFVLIGFGIWKKKPHLRLLALILFGITLLKLFLYDIKNVDSGSKTIAFISLGVLLLVISFLYTKYKHLILDDDESIEG